MINILSVDVEECFHASELKIPADPDRWRTLPAHVERQTERVLELLARHGVSATFFVLGWVAETYPRLVRTVVLAGHEIACHSYAHRLVYGMTPAEFRADTVRAIEAITSACGRRPAAYRAPSYSITRESLWALEILIECGFTYDCSIYPISHDRYGIPGFSRRAGLVNTPSGTIYEVPVATVALGPGRVAPVGGGGYLRLLPYRYTAAGIRRMNRLEHLPACMYFHPWELDPDQKPLTSSPISRLRTYGGIRGMEAKVDRLLTEFRFSAVGTVYPQGTAAAGTLASAAGD